MRRIVWLLLLGAELPVARYWIGNALLPPDLPVWEKILEEENLGEQATVLRERLVAFDREVLPRIQAFFLRFREVRRLFRRKPLPEEARAAVREMAQELKGIRLEMRAFWEEVRAQMEGAQFRALWRRKMEAGMPARGRLPEPAYLFWPLPPAAAYLLAEYMEAQPAQMERFLRTAGSEPLKRATEQAEEMVRRIERLLEDLEEPPREETWKTLEEIANLRLQVLDEELRFWEKFNASFSAEQVRMHWVIFFWERLKEYRLGQYQSRGDISPS